MSRKQIVLYIFIGILGMVLLAGLVWGNAFFARRHPLQNNFSIGWSGARSFLEYGLNPYGQTATNRTQILVYGRVAAQDQNPLRLNTPFPLLLLYFPFTLIKDQFLAGAVWMLLLEAASLGAAFLCLQLTGWRPSRMLLACVLVFSVIWIYALMPLAGGSTVIFTSLFIAGFLVALRSHLDELAGALFAFIAFTPNISSLFLLIMFWWVVSHRRWRVIWGALMLLALLFVISFLLLPDWFLPYLSAAVANLQYSTVLTPAELFNHWWPGVGDMLGWALTFVLCILLLVEWRAVDSEESRHFLWAVSLTLAFTPLIGIPVDPSHFVVLLLPLTLFLMVASQRWARPRGWGLGGILLVLIFIGLWAVNMILSRLAVHETLRAVYFLSLPVLLLAGLYWMRWYLLNPPRTFLETMEKRTD